MSKIEKFIKQVFPEYTKCIICSKELNEDKLFTICDECLPSIPFIEGNSCIKCGAPLHSDYIICLNCKDNPKYFEKNISVLSYTGAIPMLIQNFKFDKMKYLGKPFSEMIALKLKEEELPIDLIMPVPLHKDRRKERGYNQAELLLQELSEFNIPIIKDNLIRIRYNPQQAVLSKTERISNLEGAFKVLNKAEIKNKNILIVDDIYTTGSTLNSVSKTLIEAGANKVFCITLCHALQKNNIY